MLGLEEIKALGLTMDSLPTPPNPDNTEYVVAGPLAIGVEYRVSGSASMFANFGDTPGRIQELIEGFKQRDTPTVDRGITFHVCERDTKTEYLRFDCFDDGPNTQGPHYHYIRPVEREQVVVRYDADANGPMIDWALGRLQSSLPAMLRRVGASDLANEIEADATIVLEALPRIREVAAKAVLLAS